eukprot:7391648-Prymnesium_polylepis.1
MSSICVSRTPWVRGSPSVEILSTRKPPLLHAPTPYAPHAVFLPAVERTVFHPPYVHAALCAPPAVHSHRGSQKNGVDGTPPPNYAAEPIVYLSVYLLTYPIVQACTAHSPHQLLPYPTVQACTAHHRAIPAFGPRHRSAQATERSAICALCSMACDFLAVIPARPPFPLPRGRFTVGRRLVAPGASAAQDRSRRTEAAAAAAAANLATNLAGRTAAVALRRGRCAQRERERAACARDGDGRRGA